MELGKKKFKRLSFISVVLRLICLTFILGIPTLLYILKIISLKILLPISIILIISIINCPNSMSSREFSYIIYVYKDSIKIKFSRRMRIYNTIKCITIDGNFSYCEHNKQLLIEDGKNKILIPYNKKVLEFLKNLNTISKERLSEEIYYESFEVQADGYKFEYIISDHDDYIIVKYSEFRWMSLRYDFSCTKKLNGKELILDDKRTKIVIPYNDEVLEFLK